LYGTQKFITVLTSARHILITLVRPNASETSELNFWCVIQLSYVVESWNLRIIATDSALNKYSSLSVFQLYFCENNSSNIKAHDNMYCILVQSMSFAFEKHV
jgi:hypothetical protein